MKFNLPRKIPLPTVGHPAPKPETSLKTSFYNSADESAARRQAIMTRVHEKRAVVKAALRLRGQPARLQA